MDAVHRRADGNEGTIHGERGDQRRRPAEPAAVPEDRGPRSLRRPAFHSAQWDHDVDLTGKRVGVIGTGCSAAQFAPIVAEQVADLEIFQRTPNWMFPVPHYHHEVPEGFQYLLEHVPYYRQWYRFWLFWKSAELLRPMAEVDPAWPDQSRSVSELNDQLRQLLTEALEALYPDGPTCWRRCCRSTRRRPSGSSSTTARGRRRCTATTSR